MRNAVACAFPVIYIENSVYVSVFGGWGDGACVDSQKGC